jgi:hypothetical protein
VVENLNFGNRYVAPPEVTEITINDGQPSRSTVAAVSLLFNRLVQALAPTDLVLYNETTGRTVNMAAAGIAYDAQTDTAHWDLSAVTLIDGMYTATLPAAAAVDHEGRPMTEDCVFAFHVLTGDLTGDGTVGDDDLSIVLANWSGGPQGDVSGDGIVNDDDLSLLLARWGAIAGGGGQDAALAAAIADDPVGLLAKDPQLVTQSDAGPPAVVWAAISLSPAGVPAAPVDGSSGSSAPAIRAISAAAPQEQDVPVLGDPAISLLTTRIIEPGI